MSTSMVITNLSGEKIIYPNQRLEPLVFIKRLKSVFLTFLKAGTVTLLFVFIPILHFVLVPIGILVTLSSTFFAWRKEYDIENIDIHCPSCDKVSAHRLVGASLPLKAFCSHCRHMLFVNN